MSKQAKRTTLESLGQLAKHANRREPYYYGENEEYVLFYHPVFSQAKRQKLIKELMDTHLYAIENNLTELQTDEGLREYHSFLIIKYFTELYDTLQSQPLQVHIEVMNQLKDSSLMELILHEAFDAQEIDKVLYDLEKATDRIIQINKELESAVKLQAVQQKNPQLVDLALKAQKTKGKKK